PTRLRSLVPDAVCGSHPPRSGDEDHGHRQYFVVHGREYDRCGRTRRPVRARAGAPVRSLLDTSRGVDARLPAALARTLPIGGALYTAIRVQLQRRQAIMRLQIEECRLKIGHGYLVIDIVVEVNHRWPA